MLINTTAALQHYTTLSADLDFDLIKPMIRMAEKRFIIPVLGHAFYDQLNAAVIDGETGFSAVIDLVNSVTAPLAVWYYSQLGAATVDSSGIYKPKNDQRWNLSDREQKQLETSYLNMGIDALDDLLGYLALHVEDFPKYRDSDEYAREITSTLVPTAAIVEELFVLLHPRVTFRALKESIIYVENTLISEIMQDYHGLLIRKKADALTEADKAIRQAARRALIYLAMSRALITRTVTITAEGVEVIVKDGRMPVTEFENARIEASAKEYQLSGEHQLAVLSTRLRKYQPDGFVYVAPPAIVDDGLPKSVLFF